MRMNNFFLSVFTSSPLPRPQDAVVEGGVLLLPLSTVLFFRLGTRPRLVRGWAEKITPCDYFLPNTRMWSSARFYRKTERKKLFIPSTLHSGFFLYCSTGTASATFTFCLAITLELSNFQKWGNC